MLALPAAADSCWHHNGSVVRLTASGSTRTFYYETPRDSLWNFGVRSGTWLFHGSKTGDWYQGTARVFSSACPSAPLEYWAEGPVLHDPLRVQIVGPREVYRNCQPTGGWTEDVLLFTYLYEC